MTIAATRSPRNPVVPVVPTLPREKAKPDASASRHLDPNSAMIEKNGNSQATGSHVPAWERKAGRSCVP